MILFLLTLLTTPSALAVDSHDMEGTTQRANTFTASVTLAP